MATMSLPHAHTPWGFPASLADLRGPADGEVSLPLHLAWSGPRCFDVTDPSLRLLLYQVVLTEGNRSDIETYLNARLLKSVWPRLRRLLHARYVRPWEERFPELAEIAEAAEPALREQLARARRAAREGLPI